MVTCSCVVIMEMEGKLGDRHGAEGGGLCWRGQLNLACVARQLAGPLANTVTMQKSKDHVFITCSF